MARIGLVEDDPVLMDLVSRFLIPKYEVYRFVNPAELLRCSQTWDLIILDILFNGERLGFEACEKLRHFDPGLPILILSALSQPQDRIEGLKLGADDYLPKPFEMEELLLRIESILRRKRWYETRVVNNYQWAGNAINFTGFEGSCGTEQFQIPAKECMILKLLIEKEGQVVHRDEILNRVWGFDSYPTARTVDNFIVRLRKLFEPDPKRPRHIHSVRGQGYRFTKEPR